MKIPFSGKKEVAVHSEKEQAPSSATASASPQKSPRESSPKPSTGSSLWNPFSWGGDKKNAAPDEAAVSERDAVAEIAVVSSKTAQTSTRKSSLWNPFSWGRKANDSVMEDEVITTSTVPLKTVSTKAETKPAQRTEALEKRSFFSRTTRWVPFIGNKKDADENASSAEKIASKVKLQDKKPIATNTQKRSVFSKATSWIPFVGSKKEPAKISSVEKKAGVKNKQSENTLITMTAKKKSLFSRATGWIPFVGSKKTAAISAEQEMLETMRGEDEDSSFFSRMTAWVPSISVEKNNRETQRAGRLKQKRNDTESMLAGLSGQPNQPDQELAARLRTDFFSKNIEITSRGIMVGKISNRPVLGIGIRNKLDQDLWINIGFLAGKKNFVCKSRVRLSPGINHVFQCDRFKIKKNTKYPVRIMAFEDDRQNNPVFRKTIALRIKQKHLLAVSNALKAF